MVRMWMVRTSIIMMILWSLNSNLSFSLSLTAAWYHEYDIGVGFILHFLKYILRVVRYLQAETLEPQSCVFGPLKPGLWLISKLYDKERGCFCQPNQPTKLNFCCRICKKKRLTKQQRKLKRTKVPCIFKEKEASEPGKDWLIKLSRGFLYYASPQAISQMASGMANRQ